MIIHNPIIITVVAAHFLALLSPGPDFMLIVKSGIQNKINNAVGLSIGIAFANGIYIVLCIAGLGSLLMHSLILLRIIKALGGLFLVYLSLNALKTKKDDYKSLISSSESNGTESTFLKEFTTGFISGITNPKNLVFYLSLFAMILTGATSNGLKIGLGIWMTLLVFLWDSLILFILTQKRVQRIFSGIIYYVDKAAGAIIGFLGIKLILSALNDSSI